MSGEDCTERAGCRYRGYPRGVLLDALGVSKEEQLVLQNRSAYAATELVTLKLRIGAILRPREKRPVILKLTEELTVKCVRAGVRRDQDLARRSNFARDVLSRPVQLELVNGALRHVEDRRADGLVRDVLTIKEDTRCA